MIEKETLPIRKLDRSRDHEFSYLPNDESIKALIEKNDWKKLNIKGFHGALTPRDDGWELHAKLKGIVTLKCVVSDAPISHPFDLDIRRIYLFTPKELPKDYTLQDDFDYDVEELPRILSLDALLSEVILLDAPDYPKLDKYQGEQIWKTGGDDEFEEKKNPFDALKSLKVQKNDPKS